MSIERKQNILLNLFDIFFFLDISDESMATPTEVAILDTILCSGHALNLKVCYYLICSVSVYSTPSSHLLSYPLLEEEKKNSCCFLEH